VISIAGDALPFVERMRAAVNFLRFSEMKASVTVSAELAQLKTGETAESLLNRSDHALYRAKASGCDRTCVADDDFHVDERGGVP
jgi:PleD family two-component response regulator